MTQAKDIDESAILAFLSNRTSCASQFEISIAGEDSIFNAVPAGTPYKVVLAKMKSMIKRGLVRGCACGCRGDYEIIEKARKVLTEEGEEK